MLSEVAPKPENRISLMGDPNMLLPIEILGLSTRSLNALKHADYRPYEQIYFIGQLLTKDMEGLKKIINLGAKSITEITDGLAARGYKVGEAKGQVTGIQYRQTDDLRQIYQIPEDVPTPTEWVAIEGREQVHIPKNLEGQMLTRKFNHRMYVHLPYDVTDQVKLSAIQDVLQKAFEIAVDHAFDVARHPEKKPNLVKALKKHIPFDAKTEYPSRSNMHAHVTLSEQMTELLKEGALDRIAYAFDYKVMCGLVMSVLEPKI